MSWIELNVAFWKILLEFSLILLLRTEELVNAIEHIPGKVSRVFMISGFQNLNAAVLKALGDQKPL